jgi:hypothetical protein
VKGNTREPEECKTKEKLEGWAFGVLHSDEIVYSVNKWFLATRTQVDNFLKCNIALTLHTLTRDPRIQLNIRTLSWASAKT